VRIAARAEEARHELIVAELERLDEDARAHRWSMTPNLSEKSTWRGADELELLVLRLASMEHDADGLSAMRRRVA